MTERLVEVKNLKKWFPVRSFLWRRKREHIRAVDGVNFEVKKGETLCLAGESGCGKTTTALTMVRLIEPSAGKVTFMGYDMFSLKTSELRQVRQHIGMVFQDPYASLNPRLTVSKIIWEPLAKSAYTKTEMREKVLQVLEKVKLLPPEDVVKKYPHQLSGGQRQRVALARAIIGSPSFIILDEPLSMVDMSIRIGILNLISAIRREHNLTYLLITHDLSTARYMANRTVIMYLGKIVEVAPMEELLRHPLHPYNEALLSVTPAMRSLEAGKQIILKGEIPNPLNIPSGCRFHPRCRYCMDICRKKEPELVEARRGHYVACHLTDKI